MDATRETVPVKIAGREVNMYKPTEDQVVGLQMTQTPGLPEGAALKALTGLFMSLLPTDDDKEWAMTQMCAGGYSLADLTNTIKRVVTYKPEPPKARKAAARAK